MNLTPAQKAYVNATFTSGGALAHSVVARAIAKGTLEKPHYFKCVDCGNDAACYDHRDYTYPLAVDPVCRSCNTKRGPASPKVWESETDFMAYMTSCKSVKWQCAFHGFDISLHATPKIRGEIFHSGNQSKKAAA